MFWRAWCGSWRCLGFFLAGLSAGPGGDCAWFAVPVLVHGGACAVTLVPGAWSCGCLVLVLRCLVLGLGVLVLGGCRCLFLRVLSACSGGCLVLGIGGCLGLVLGGCLVPWRLRVPEAAVLGSRALARHTRHDRTNKTHTKHDQATKNPPSTSTRSTKDPRHDPVQNFSPDVLAKSFRRQPRPRTEPARMAAGRGPGAGTRPTAERAGGVLTVRAPITVDHRNERARRSHPPDMQHLLGAAEVRRIQTPHL